MGIFHGDLFLYWRVHFYNIYQHQAEPKRKKLVGTNSISGNGLFAPRFFFCRMNLEFCCGFSFSPEKMNDTSQFLGPKWCERKRAIWSYPQVSKPKHILVLSSGFKWITSLCRIFRVQISQIHRENAGTLGMVP